MPAPDASTAPLTSLQIREILALLPHRFPMLLLDRVLECTPGERVVALKNVSINEPQFQGHFPERPILPGVLIVESIAQAAGIITLSAHPDYRRKAFYLAGLDGFRFRRPVIPGDQLRITVTRTAARRNVWQFEAQVTVEGLLVCEGTLLATTADPPQDQRPPPAPPEAATEKAAPPPPGTSADPERPGS